MEAQSKSRSRMEAPILGLDPDLLVRLWPAERVLVCAFQCKTEPAVSCRWFTNHLRSCSRALRKAQPTPFTLNQCCLADGHANMQSAQKGDAVCQTCAAHLLRGGVWAGHGRLPPAVSKQAQTLQSPI
jgi:hypothetical protein